MTATTSRLAGMFDDEPTPEAGALVAEPAATPTPERKRQGGKREAGKGAARQAPAAAPKSAARTTGKRSDPAYKLTGLFVRRDTQADVMDRLRRTGEYADVSELTQALWEAWLKKKGA